MPKVDPAEQAYKLKLASLLALFRSVTGETHDALEERMGLVTGKWGRWERGAHPPKAHELIGIYKAFRKFGLEMEWLLTPPDIVGVNAIRERLIASARAGTIAADEAEARAMVRRLRSGGRLAGVRGKRSA